ncbi:MAG: hypothetical protein JW862_02780 [Anaerolineales bacterium]|nr:hypothetical protein [Anaerolineales bacterium]
MLASLALPAVILIAITAMIILAVQGWRLRVSALAAQYVGVFILVAQIWPLEMAVVKLIAGWICASILGMALASLPAEERIRSAQRTAEVAFRLMAAALIGLVVYALLPVMARWLPGASQAQILGSLMLAGLGILNFGLSVKPLRIDMGLLSLLAGFEILYATVEPSLLVAGMLAVTNMGIALMGAYLILAPEMELEE